MADLTRMVELTVQGLDSLRGQYLEAGLHTAVFGGLSTFAGFVFTAKMWLVVHLHDYAMRSGATLQSASSIALAKRSGERKDANPHEPLMEISGKLRCAIVGSMSSACLQLVIPFNLGLPVRSVVFILSAVSATLSLGYAIYMIHTVSNLVRDWLKDSGATMIAAQEAEQRRVGQGDETGGRN